MRLAAALITVVILDAVSFAAVASLPGVVAYELNPITRAIVGAVGVGGFVALKIGLALVTGLLVFRVQGNRLRLLVAIVTIIVAIGAVSNFIAIDQLRRTL